MSDRATKNCVYCGRKAKSWSGHVLHGKETITAGWCNRRECRSQGFVGHYKKWMQEKLYE